MNNEDSQGFNCLYYATYHGHLSIVAMLKKLGCDYKKDKKDTSCMHIAITRGFVHILKFFLTKADKNAIAALRSSPPQSPSAAKRAPPLDDAQIKLKENKLNK